MKKLLILLVIILTAAPVFSADVKFTWDNSTSTVDGYRLFHHEEGESYTTTPSIETTEPTGTITGLEIGKTYYFIVRSHRYNIESVNSDEIVLPIEEASQQFVTPEKVKSFRVELIVYPSP